MGSRILKTLSRVILVAALLIPSSLFASWEKVTWDAPKSKKGKTQGGGPIGFVGKNDAYLGFGGSHLYHWNGKSLKEIKHKHTGSKKWDLREFVVNSKKDIWAFGDNGLSLHFTGKKWTNVKNPLTGKGRRPGRLWGAGCISPSKCWAGSRAGDLIEWNGSSWKLVSKSGEPPAEGSRVYAMGFTSAKNGWMVGESLVAKWDGKAWKKQGTEVPRIYSMHLGKDYGWLVGDGGAFFRLEGGAWKKFNVKGSFFRMRGVSCTSKSNCWAVGDAGAAFKWDGKSWTKVKLGTFARMSRIKFAYGQGLIVGGKGLIFQWK
ncbi:MAG: hypothetical protein ACE5HC_11765 [Candidatus Binatia bacterium]